MTRVVLALALAACNTPVPSLNIALAGPPNQSCPDLDCSHVEMLCATVMSIRIIDPGNPQIRHLDQCVEVIPDGGGDLCALSSVDLEATPLPVHDLEVDVAVFPKTSVPRDPATGALLCPETNFAASGFPVEQAPAPALGGRAFYHPGDSSVNVVLGCTDLESIKDSCQPDNEVSVTATIDEFQSQFPVTTASDTAEHLRVAIGEPRASGLGFVLDPSDVHELALLDDTSAGASDTATWTANIDNLAINQYACIEVFDESANGPGMVRCARASTASPLAQALALKGIWIDPETVAKVLENLSSDPWPTSLQNGLTLGMVINGATPASGYVVLSSNASGNLSQSPTVSYLSDSGFGGSATSSNGLFISRDAPFGTQFSIGGQGLPTMGVTGGAVNSKITVVILPVPAQ